METKKLLNKNFILLIQGQMVSALGDSFGDIALDFYVYFLTKSSTVMGIVMALVTIPRIIVGPFAGAVADKFSRKFLVVTCDVMRGILMLLLATFSYYDVLSMWFIYFVAILFGLMACFFNPAVDSWLPEMVPEDSLVKANSIEGMTNTGAQIVGQALGGALYTALGAISLFFFNGISYIISAISENFISEKKRTKNTTEKNIIGDIRGGFEYIIGNIGLRKIIMASCLINLLFGMIQVILVPWFANNPELGTAKYGVFNAIISIASVCGMLLLALIDIKKESKYKVFISSMIIFSLSVAVSAFVNKFYFILIGFFIAFAFQIVFNTILISSVMEKTPENMRGKVSATRLSLVLLATPIGQLLGGRLGDLFEPNKIIVVNAVVALLVVILVVKNKDVESYISG